MNIFEIYRWQSRLATNLIFPAKLQMETVQRLLQKSMQMVYNNKLKFRFIFLIFIQILAGFKVSNVVCNFSLPMHIDLRRIVMKTKDVELDRVRNVIYKRKRNPACLANIYMSGKVHIVGCRRFVENF